MSQTQIAAASTGTAQPINVINTAGALKGNPPVTFDGDRNKSRGFLVAFKLYKGVNRQNSSMTNPYSRVLNILTYIEGDNVNSWKESQLKKLEDRVAAGTLESDEAHWTIFEREFKDAFTNTNAKAEAYQQLTRLKHGDNLDTFIAQFKKLIEEAGVDQDSHGVIELFKNGLKPGLTQAIIGSQHFNPINPWDVLDRWIQEALAQHIKWKMKQQYSQRNQLRQNLYTAFKVKGGRGGNGKRLTTSQGGDAMDLDAIRTNNLTEAQKTELMKENKCFYCQKPGHQAKACFKKKCDQAGRTSSANATSSTPTNSTSSQPFDIKAFGEALKEHGPNLDEDAKLNMVEMLLPGGFVQALD